MASEPLLPLLWHIRRSVAAVPELTDQQLLDRFHSDHDEAAFQVLLTRHGPMVLGVCRRLLRHEQDAEDAFQATFLVLACKAGAIRHGRAVGSWLYEVAYHIAVKARARAARRHSTEQHATIPTPDDDPHAALTWRDVRPVLDEELNRLPAAYRRPLVLCYLEGLTQEQAARELGWTKGTVSGRLARARQLLHSRLTRRGLALTPAVLVLALTTSAEASLPAALAQTTLRTAVLFADGAGAVPSSVAVLAQGVLKAMTAIRAAGTLMALLLIGVLGAGLVGLFTPTQAADPQPAGAKANPNAAADDDPLPAGAVLQLGTARLRHGHQVQSVAFAPDGKTFASTGWDHLARLWDAETGKAVRTFGEQDQRINPYATSRWIHSLAFSPDGQLLATGEFATGWNVGTIRIWEVATGKKLHELTGDQSGVLTLAFSPDSKVLASGSVNGTVRLWNVDQGTEMNQLAAGVKSVLTIAFRGKGQRLVVHGADGQVQFWKTPKDQLIEKEGDPLRDVDAMACSPDGSLLALGDPKGQVRLWDPAAGKELQKWSAGQEGVRGLSFSPDGKVLAAGTEGGVVKVWEVGGKEVGAIAKHRGPIQAVAVSPGAKRLASVLRGDNTIGFWDVAPGKPVVKSAGYEGQVRPLRFSPDGKTLLSSSRDRGLHRWDAATGQLLKKLQGEHFADHAAALAADGKTAAWAGGPGIIHIIDWQTGQEVRQWKALGAGIWALAFSPEGKLVAATAGNDTLGVWDAATGQSKLSLEVKDGDKAALLLFSPDGKKLLRLSGKTGGGLLDVASGEWTMLPPDTSAGLGAAFSPDGSLLAIGGTAGTVGLWDANHGRLLRILDKQPGYVQSLDFSRDGRTLAAGSWKSVYLWETATGLERGHFESLEGDTWSLAFAPDGRTLAAGCGDSTIVVLGLAGPLKTLGEEELARQWKLLGGDNASEAFQALKALAGSPEQALPLLQKELKPTPKHEGGQVEKLIADLDSDEFTKREKAREELEKLGTGVVGALRKVLTNAPSVEVRKRVEVLLERIEGTQASPERVTMLRRLELLERLRTADARRLLERLAEGEPAAEQTLEASRALKRSATD